MKNYDVAIIGSGPSGASTAFHLAKKGIKAVIIEKEILPRYKVCGGGFVFRGRRNFPIDISDVIEREFFKVDNYIDKKRLQITREDPIITMIMRDSFDHLIVKEAQKLGVDILEDHKLVGLTEERDRVICKTSKEDISAKFVIAADGVLSPTAKLAGWKNETRNLIPALEYEVKVPEKDFQELSDKVRFDFFVVPNGYAWCFPKKNHLSIGVLTTKKKRINLKEYYQKYLKTLGVTEIVEQKQYGFQIPISSRTDGYTKGRVFLIGDAAGFAEPITAEGISNAIYSGKLAAESIIDANLDLIKAAELYNKSLQKEIVPQLRSAEYLSNFFYKNKAMSKLVVQVYGQRFAEYMVDILMGEKEIPKNVKQKLKQKIKEAVF